MSHKKSKKELLAASKRAVGPRIYAITIESAAQKSIDKMEPDMQAEIVVTIRGLATNPRPYGVEKMTAKGNSYRYRTGNYRIVYRIFDKELRVIVIEAGDRKEVYKRSSHSPVRSIRSWWSKLWR